MKIEIVCPECGYVLQDRFSARSCKVVSGSLEMECIRCDELYMVGVSIVATKKAPVTICSLVPEGFCPPVVACILKTAFVSRTQKSPER